MKSWPMYFSLFTQNSYYVEKQFETISKFSYGIEELPLLFLLVFILIFLLVFLGIVRGHGSNDLANGVRLGVDTRQTLQDTLIKNNMVLKIRHGDNYDVVLTWSTAGSLRASS